MSFDGRNVYIFQRHLSLNPTGAIFHASGEWASIPGRDELRSVCGLILYAYPRPNYEPPVRFRLDVARLFARPCERCH